MKEIILCDRYIISSLALQHAEGVSLECVWDINKYFPQPDICFIISASVESLDNRINKREKKSHFKKTCHAKKKLINFAKRPLILHRLKGAMFIGLKTMKVVLMIMLK